MELGITTLRAFPVAAVVLCWQPVSGTGGEDCLPFSHGTSTSPLVVERKSVINNVAAQIGALKEALRLSHSEVGNIFGVTRQTVHNWMKGDNVLADHRRKLLRVMDGFATVESTLSKRKEFFNDRALVGEKNLVQLLAEDRYEAFELLRDLLLRSDDRIAMLKRDANGKAFEAVPSHFDSLD
jgi:transcriptional regulator with XRE-family HTH domain